MAVLHVSRGCYNNSNFHAFNREFNLKLTLHTLCFPFQSILRVIVILIRLPDEKVYRTQTSQLLVIGAPTFFSTPDEKKNICFFKEDVCSLSFTEFLFSRCGYYAER